MTDFQSRPSVPPNDDDDPAPEPTLWSKLRGAIANASGLATNLAATVVLSVLVIVTGWMGIEQAAFWWNSDHTEHTAKRDFLCNKHVYTAPPAAQPKIEPTEESPTRVTPNAVAPAQATQNEKDLAEVQEMVVEIYALKEMARQHAIPFDTVGRVRHFFRCGNVTDVSATTLKFAFTEGQRKPYSQDLRALHDWEKSGFDFVERQFSEMIPTIIMAAWEQRLDLLGTSLSKIETEDAPIITQTPSETAVADQKELVLVKPDANAINDAWLLIVASDVNTSAALTEVRKLRAALARTFDTTVQGGSNVTFSFSKDRDADWADYVAMYETGKRIRTVVAFEDKESADIARQVLQTTGEIRLDSYTRNVNAWCGGTPTKIDTDAADTNGVPIYLCS